MKRIVMMLSLAALLVAALTVTSAGAFAASPSEQQCTDSGGTFSRDGGQVSCTTPGKNENQPKFNQTDTSNGTLNNKPQKTESCGKPCPPGQFN
jgi:hypothetical protein